MRSELLEKKYKRNLPKARQICEMYHSGLTMSVIAKELNIGTNQVVQYLDRYYSYFYGEEWKRKRLTYNDAELYNKFMEVYTPLIYRRKELCEKMGCSIAELEHMCKTYNISFLRCGTYKNQKTLCNVPEEIYDDIKRVVKEKGMSVRELVMLAVNEYLLREYMEKRGK